MITKGSRNNRNGRKVYVSIEKRVLSVHSLATIQWSIMYLCINCLWYTTEWIIHVLSTNIIVSAGKYNNGPIRKARNKRQCQRGTKMLGAFTDHAQPLGVLLYSTFVWPLYTAAETTDEFLPLLILQYYYCYFVLSKLLIKFVNPQHNSRCGRESSINYNSLILAEN